MTAHERGCLIAETLRLAHIACRARHQLEVIDHAGGRLDIPDETLAAYGDVMRGLRLLEDGLRRRVTSLLGPHRAPLSTS